MKLKKNVKRIIAGGFILAAILLIIQFGKTLGNNNAMTAESSNHDTTVQNDGDAPSDNQLINEADETIGSNLENTDISEGNEAAEKESIEIQTVTVSDEIVIDLEETEEVGGF